MNVEDPWVSTSLFGCQSKLLHTFDIMSGYNNSEQQFQLLFGVSSYTVMI